MKKSNQLTIEFTALAENISFARVAVAAFASQLDFTLDDLEEIKVIVSEAVGNSIIHGYNNAHDQTVIIHASINNTETLNLSIEDRGRGIEDVNGAMEAGYSTDPERMGLGFVFMQSFAEQIKVDSRPGEGTKIKITKKASASKNKTAQTAH